MQETSTSLDAGESSDSINSGLKAQQDKVIKRSIASAWRMIIFHGLKRWLEFSILPVWALYATELGASPSYIGFASAAFCLAVSVTDVVLPWIGDNVGFDIALIYAFFGTTVSLFIQAFAQNFWMLVAGRVILALSQGCSGISMGYIFLILPKKYARTYSSYNESSLMIAFLIGPITSGLMVNTFGFEITFLIVGCCSLVSLGLTIIFFRGEQKRLLAAQEMTPIYGAVEIGKRRPSMLNSQFPEMGCNEWITVGLVLVLALFVSGVVNSLVNWQSLYMNDRFHSHSLIVLSTGQLSVAAVFVIISVICSPLILSYLTKDSNDPKKALKVLLIFVVIAAGIGCVFMTVAFIQHISPQLFWLILGGGGLAFGILDIGRMLIMLEVAPSEHGGKLTGLAFAFENLGALLFNLAIGIYWHNDVQTLYVFCAASLGIICVVYFLRIVGDVILSGKK